MKRLLWLLWFFCLPALGETHTLTWCAIKWPSTAYGGWYEVCIEPTAPIGDCTTPVNVVWWGSTSYSFSIPTGSSVWLRVRATANAETLIGPYSNPVQVIAGLTPPAVGGCP